MFDAILCWAARRSSAWSLLTFYNSKLREENDNFRSANSILTRKVAGLRHHVTSNDGERDLFVYELKRRKGRLKELGDTEFCRNWMSKVKVYRKSLEDLVDNRPAAEIAADEFMKNISGSVRVPGFGKPGFTFEAFGATKVSGGPDVSSPEEGVTTVQIGGKKDV